MYGWTDTVLGFLTFPVGLAAVWFATPLIDRTVKRGRVDGVRGLSGMQWSVLALVVMCVTALPLLRLAAWSVDSGISVFLFAVVAPALSVWLPALLVVAGGLLVVGRRLGAILSGVFAALLVAASLPHAKADALLYAGATGWLKAAVADAWLPVLIMLACLWSGAAVHLVAHHRTSASTRRSDATLIP